MSAPRDVFMAKSLQKMAAYGYLDDEFIFYGYLYGDEEHLIYKVSDSLLKIYEAVHQSVYENEYPSLVGMLCKNVSVPSGEYYYYERKYKFEMVQQLREHYGERFIRATDWFKKVNPSDQAYDLLQKYIKNNVLQEERRQVFDGLCHIALEIKLLSLEAYEDLQNDVNRLYGVKPSIKKPTAGRGKLMSGFGYWHPQTQVLNYYVSAMLEECYQKHYKFAQNGIYCTPIITKSYWFDSANTFKKIKLLFQEVIELSIRESKAIEIVEYLKSQEPVVNKQYYQFILEELKQNATKETVQAFQGYGYRFNILR